MPTRSWGSGQRPTPTQRRARLRARLSDGTLVLPGVTDALGARLVEAAGFDAAYATGAGLANAQFGVPDVGLISLGEVVDHVDRLTSATTLPLVVDADTGFGGPLMAMRAVRQLERAGAAALQLEDQEMPKRCGHFDYARADPGRPHAGQARRRAGRPSRTTPTVLIARTDARSVHDIDEAIRRGHAYVEAGADVIFVEAPRTVEELARVGRRAAPASRWSSTSSRAARPRSSPWRSTRDLGFGVVLFANFLMRSMITAGREALAHLAAHGETGHAGRPDGHLGASGRRCSTCPQFTAARGALRPRGAVR